MAIELTKFSSMKPFEIRFHYLKSILSEKAEPTSRKSRVVLALDTSSAMMQYFESEEIQMILEKIMPIAYSLTDDGNMDLWTFNNKFQVQPAVTKVNYSTYFKDQIVNPNGKSFYPPVIEATTRYYGLTYKPAYVLFITCGHTNYAQVCDYFIRTASLFPVFFQFIGIGSADREDYPYLNSMDSMLNRYVCNTNFLAVKSFADFALKDDKELYTYLMDRYFKWVNIDRVKGLLNVHSMNPVWHQNRMNTLNYCRSSLEKFESKGINAFDVFLDILGIAADLIEDCLLS